MSLHYRIEIGSNDEFKPTFYELATQLEAHCHRIGLHHIKATYHESLPHFSALSTEQKQSSIEALRQFVSVCDTTIKAGHNLDDHKKLTWYALKQMGYLFDSGLFGLIGEDDTIEVYDPEMIQTFRTFNFFEDVSYSIEDLYCRSWVELFQREDPQIAMESLQICERICKGEITEIVNTQYLGVHRIREVMSPFKYNIDFLLKYICPLYDEYRKPTAVLCIDKGQKHEKRLSKQQKEELLTEYYKAGQDSNSHPKPDSSHHLKPL